MNFLQETLEAVENSGHKPEDIIFIGSNDYKYACTLDEFKLMANREYNDGLGSAEVAQDLIVVFSDGSRMWRGEYDGSEWWNHSIPFVKTEQEPLSIARLIVWPSQVGWCDVGTIQFYTPNQEDMET